MTTLKLLYMVQHGTIQTEHFFYHQKHRLRTHNFNRRNWGPFFAHCTIITECFNSYSKCECDVWDGWWCNRQFKKQKLNNRSMLRTKYTCTQKIKSKYYTYTLQSHSAKRMSSVFCFILLKAVSTSSYSEQATPLQTQYLEYLDRRFRCCRYTAFFRIIECTVLWLFMCAHTHLVDFLSACYFHNIEWNLSFNLLDD